MEYPHIKSIIRVAGDADYRLLELSLRYHGIQTTMLCGAQRASED